MWYAASEIVFFLVLAAVIGGLIGYGIAQIYQIDFAALRAARSEAGNEAGDDHRAELVAAYGEIADLRRKLQIATDALRGDEAPKAVLEPPVIQPSASVVTEETYEASFPPVPESATADASVGRRLSDRVADAEHS